MTRDTHNKRERCQDQGRLHDKIRVTRLPCRDSLHQTPKTLRKHQPQAPRLLRRTLRSREEPLGLCISSPDHHSSIDPSS